MRGKERKNQKAYAAAVTGREQGMDAGDAGTQAVQCDHARLFGEEVPAKTQALEEAEQRSILIQDRVRSDFVTNLRVHLGLMFAPSGAFLDDLEATAMHYVDEVLADLAEIKSGRWLPAGGNMFVCPKCGESGWLVPSS